MTVTNLALAQQINLATVLNTKLEAPLLQSEMELDVAATATKKAVRWDEFTVKHDNAGNFKVGIVATADVANLAVTTAKISDAAVTQRKIKTKAVVALADTATILTGAQLIDSGIFTAVPTVARTQTTDTAANIIAAMPGAATGMWSDFSISVTAAFDETLVSGTGVTLVGKMVLNDRSGTFKILVTSGTTVTIYRQD